MLWALHSYTARSFEHHGPRRSLENALVLVQRLLRHQTSHRFNLRTRYFNHR